jgi:hypothetical protein
MASNKSGCQLPEVVELARDLLQPRDAQELADYIWRVMNDIRECAHAAKDVVSLAHPSVMRGLFTALLFSLYQHYSDLKELQAALSEYLHQSHDLGSKHVFRIGWVVGYVMAQLEEVDVLEADETVSPTPDSE